MLKEKELVEVRREALAKVKAWYASIGAYAETRGGAAAWLTLEHVARMHPDWRIAEYCWNAETNEIRAFKAAWEAWRREVTEE